MSDADFQTTDTLLPQSAVYVFSNDTQTLSAAESLKGDWRFGRVKVKAEKGDVDSAIAFFAEYQSPDVLIVQTDVIDDGFVAKLEELAGNCDEGTEAVVIGPDNDVYLYRKLIDMGVSDYLVKPVSAEMLSEVIARTLIQQHGISGSKLVAFIGAKGGVGASTIARSVGWILSEELEAKLLLIDASGGWSANPVGIGFEPSTRFSEAVKAAERNDQDSLKRMIYQASERFSVLASGGDVMLETPMTREKFESLLEVFMVKNPVVFVDVSGAVPEVQKMVLARAHKIVLVSNATVSCLRLARSLAQEIKDIRGGDADDIALTINMSGFAASYEMPKGDIQTAMEMPIAAIVPYEPKLFVQMESEGAPCFKEKGFKDIQDNVLLPFIEKALGFTRSDKAASANDDGRTIFSGLLGKLAKK